VAPYAVAHEHGGQGMPGGSGIDNQDVGVLPVYAGSRFFFDPERFGRLAWVGDVDRLIARYMHRVSRTKRG
jgi:hypothetical protein